MSYNHEEKDGQWTNFEIDNLDRTDFQFDVIPAILGIVCLAALAMLLVVNFI